MTDNETKKAFEEHIERTKNIKYGARKMVMVDVELLKNALDLINRQQAEIERLKSMNFAKLDTIHDLQSEIERLKKENEILSINADTAFQDGLNEAQDLYAEQVKDEIKSEAIKELIDKLEPDHTFEIQRDDGYWEKVVRLESIKAIAKELVGDTE